MSNERKPLLTEEQIQEMLEYAKARGGDDQEGDTQLWLWQRHRVIWHIVENNICNPTVVGMDKFLAFLRGKTKRVLNLDSLRADVKAWVDDPNRKYPEWVMAVIHEKNRQMLVGNHTDDLSDDELCCYALAIGINPDDYFEELIIEE